MVSSVGVDGCDSVTTRILNRIPATVPQRRLLQVAQVWQGVVLDTQHFGEKSPEVTVGSGVGCRWSVAGVDLGWVKPAYAPILGLTPPLLSDVTRAARQRFQTEGAPAILALTGAEFVCRIEEGWRARVWDPEGERSMESLIGDGSAWREDGAVHLRVTEGRRIRVDVGSSTFCIGLVPAGARVARSGLEADPMLTGLVGMGAFLAVLFGVVVGTTAPRMEVSVAEVADRLVEVQRMELPPPPEERVRLEEIAGGGDSRPEGKIGKKEGDHDKAKGGSPEADKQFQDRQIVEAAGLLGALNDLGQNSGAWGSSMLNENLIAGAGGLIGAKGTQIGSFGLGSRGTGLGNGSRVESLGGMGLGSGNRAFRPTHGQCEGEDCKPRGKIVADDGGVHMIGGLTRGQIDEVIQRSMAQIRYCYQRELNRQPDLAGKVTVKFTIARDGTVSSSAVKTSSLGNESAESCLVGRFYRMNFPEPMGGGAVLVSYPFLFAPGS